jgi:hypothetical protein
MLKKFGITLGLVGLFITGLATNALASNEKITIYNNSPFDLHYYAAAGFLGQGDFDYNTIKAYHSETKNIGSYADYDYMFEAVVTPEDQAICPNAKSSSHPPIFSNPIPFWPFVIDGKPLPPFFDLHTLNNKQLCNLIGSLISLANGEVTSEYKGYPDKWGSEHYISCKVDFSDRLQPKLKCTRS